MFSERETLIMSPRGINARVTKVIEDHFYRVQREKGDSLLNGTISS